MSQMAHPPQHPPQQHLPPGMSHPPPLGAPMMTAPSGSSGHPSNQSSPTLHNRSDSWEGDKMLHVYMLDYCRKRGFTAVVNALCSQTGTVPDAKAPIDAPQGLLYEWWVVFWDIFTAKISENGGSRDAITFHQYQGLHKDQVRHAHFAKQGGAAGAAGGPPPQPGGGPPPPPGAPGPSGLQFTSPHANGIQPPPQHGAQQPFMNGMGHPPPQHPPPPPQSSQQPPPPHHSGPAFHQPQGPGGQQPPPPPHGAQQQQPQQPPHPQPNGPHAPPNGLQQPPPGGQMMNGPPGSQQQQQGPHPPPTIINGPQPYPPQMGHPQQQGPPHPGQHPGMIGGPHGPQPGQQQPSHPGPHHPNQPGQPPHMQGQMHGGPPGQQPQNPNPAMAGGARPQGQPMTTHIAGLQAQAQAQSQALAAAQGRSGHASPFAGGGAPGPSPRMTNMGPPNGIPSTPNMGGPTGAPPPAGGFQRPGSRAETPSTQGGQPSGQQGMMNMSPQRQGSINRPTSGMQGAMGPGGAHPPFQTVPPTMLEQAMRTIGLGGRDPGSLNQDDKIKLNNQIKRMQTGTPRLQSMQANTTGSPSGGSGAGTPPQSFMAPQSGFGNNFGAGPGGGGPPGPGGPGYGGPGFAGGQRPLQEYSQQVVQSMMGVGGKRVGSPMQTDNPPQDSSPPDKKRARRNSNSGMGPAGGMPTGFNPQQPQPGGPPQQPHPMSMQQQPNGTMRPPSIGPTGAQPGQQPQQQQPGGAMMNGVGGPGGMGQGVMSSMSMRNAPPGQQQQQQQQRYPMTSSLPQSGGPGGPTTGKPPQMMPNPNPSGLPIPVPDSRAPNAATGGGGPGTGSPPNQPPKMGGVGGPNPSPSLANKPPPQQLGQQQGQAMRGPSRTPTMQNAESKMMLNKGIKEDPSGGLDMSIKSSPNTKSTMPPPNSSTPTPANNNTFGGPAPGGPQPTPMSILQGAGHMSSTPPGGSRPGSSATLGNLGMTTNLANVSGPQSNASGLSRFDLYGPESGLTGLEDYDFSSGLSMGGMMKEDVLGQFTDPFVLDQFINFMDPGGNGEDDPAAAAAAAAGGGP